VVLVISGIGVYVVLGGGWSSNSKYALLGAYRGVVQTISYEVGFRFIVLRFLLIRKSYNIFDLLERQSFLFIIIV